MIEVSIILAMIALVVIVVIAIGVLAFIANDWKEKYHTKQLEYDKLLSQKKSSEVRVGQISEQLAPFLDAFPYNPKRAHFIGQPIDYIIFEDDKIIFLEVKSGRSRLSSTQKSIKGLITSGKVAWEEIRIDGETGQAERGRDVGSEGNQGSASTAETDKGRTTNTAGLDGC